MLAIAQRLRNTNGFMKSATVDISANVSLSSDFIYRLPNPTLVKAADTSLAEWSTKLVSNKIKIVGVAYNLTVQTQMPNITGTYPTSVPVRIDAIRMAQTVPMENIGRITSTNSYLQKHSYSLPSTVSNVIDVSSMFTLPLESASTGYVKVYDMNQKDVRPHVAVNYNNNQVNNTAFRADIVCFQRLLPVDCYLEIPDDGLAVTTVNLSECVGEVPELCYVTTWNQRSPISPFALTHTAYVVGQVSVLYQDIGTKLSHL